jgi:hypothetical protein
LFIGALSHRLQTASHPVVQILNLAPAQQRLIELLRRLALSTALIELSQVEFRPQGVVFVSLRILVDRLAEGVKRLIVTAQFV